MVTFTHAKVSGKADGTDDTLVKPTDWNADHKVVTAAASVYLGRDSSGPGPVQELPVSSIFPIGIVIAFAGSPLAVPVGWYACDATVRPNGDSPELAAILGNIYGGVAGVSFAVPDLRGRVIGGLDAGTGRLPGWNAPGNGGGSASNSAGMGNKGVSYSSFVGTLNAEANRTSFATGEEFVDQSGSGGGSNFDFPNKDHNHQYNVHNIPVLFGGSLLTTANTLTDAFSIVQSTVVMNYIIKR